MGRHEDPGPTRARRLLHLRNRSVHARRRADAALEGMRDAESDQRGSKRAERDFAKLAREVVKAFRKLGRSSFSLPIVHRQRRYVVSVAET